MRLKENKLFVDTLAQRTALKQAPSCYVCKIPPLTLESQPESKPDAEVGPKGMLMLAYRHVVGACLEAH